MEKILIINNISREGPGLLADVLAEKGIDFEIVDLGTGQRPGKVADYKAVVVLGGPDSANDSTDKILYELAFVKEVLASGIPYLGICLGMQVLVKAAGGKVLKCKVKEVGFRDDNNELYKVFLTSEGKKDPIFAGMPDSFPVFQLHGETVSLIPQMKLLASGKGCRNQIVRTGPGAYGIQCHLELTPEMLEIWIREDPDLRHINKDHLHSDTSLLTGYYAETGITLLRNFLRIAGF